MKYTTPRTLEQYPKRKPTPKPQPKPSQQQLSNRELSSTASTARPKTGRCRVGNYLGSYFGNYFVNNGSGRILKALASIALTAGFSATTQAAAVDLSSWQIDGGGAWTFDTTNSPNDSALQAVNSPPTVLFNNTNSQGTLLAGSVEVRTTSDDDFFGFVLGYNDDDLAGSNPDTDYILIDWKQGTQSGWARGMAISRVTGGPLALNGTDVNGDAWTHTGHVEFLERAATLGNAVWQDNTEYSFNILFTSTNIQVFIDEVLQFDINGTFNDGSFGFYNFSQPSVFYSTVTTAPVPLPATFWLFGAGLASLSGLRRVQSKR